MILVTSGAPRNRGRREEPRPVSFSSSSIFYFFFFLVVLRRVNPSTTVWYSASISPHFRPEPRAPRRVVNIFLNILRCQTRIIVNEIIPPVPPLSEFRVLSTRRGCGVRSNSNVWWTMKFIAKSVKLAIWFPHLVVVFSFLFLPLSHFRIRWLVRVCVRICVRACVCLWRVALARLRGLCDLSRFRSRGPPRIAPTRVDRICRAKGGKKGAKRDSRMFRRRFRFARRFNVRRRRRRARRYHVPSARIILGGENSSPRSVIYPRGHRNVQFPRCNRRYRGVGVVSRQSRHLLSCDRCVQQEKKAASQLLWKSDRAI